MLQRKTLSIYIICIVVLLLCLFPASAADGVISAGTVSAEPGGTADVEVRLDGNPGIVAALLNIEYDASALTLTGAENGTVFADDTAVFSKDLSLVPFTVLWEDGLSPENHTADGVLVTLHFAVQADAKEGEYTIALHPDENSMLNVDLQMVSFQIRDGAVRVGASSAGGQTGLIVAVAAVTAVVCFAIAGSIIVRKRKGTNRNSDRPA